MLCQLLDNDTLQPYREGGVSSQENEPLEAQLPASLHSPLFTEVDENKLCGFIRAISNREETLFPNLAHIIDLSSALGFPRRWQDLGWKTRLTEVGMRAMINTMKRVDIDFYAKERSGHFEWKNR